MSQPLIFKKQIISDLILVAALILEYLLNADNTILKVTLFYLINVLGITFVPSIRGFRYDWHIRHFIYYLPMVLPIFFFHLNPDKVNYIGGASLGILIGILLLLSNYKQNIEIIFGENIKSKVPINSKEITNEIYTAFIAPICEELFYRYFLIGILYPIIGYYSIISSTLLFVYSHFINRWANVMFDVKSYIYHFVTGALFSILYIYTRSILGCMIAHIIFNSIDLFTLYKRLRITKKHSEESSGLFDDYQK